MFKCDKCGECCRNLNKSNLYDDLNRGDGICKYLEGNICSIYEDRPLLCRVDESYELLFKEIINRSDYYKFNYESCKILKAKTL